MSMREAVPTLRTNEQITKVASRLAAPNGPWCRVMGVTLIVQDLLNLGVDEAPAVDTWPVEPWEGSHMGNFNVFEEHFVLGALSDMDEIFAEKEIPCQLIDLMYYLRLTY